MKELETTLDYALWYISKGFSVIPIKPKDKQPAIDSWKAFQEHKPTEHNLKAWFGNGAHNGIGIVTGEISGLAVVDLDEPEAVKFAKDHNFPETPLVKTGRGYHLYYRYKEGVRNFQRRDNLPGIDLRGDGGQAVAPPSIHVSGAQYQWVKGKGLDDLPLAELPEIILAQKPEDKTPLKELYQGVPNGRRNDSLARLVGSWVSDGLSFEECLQMAYQWNERNLPPETDRRKIERTVESIFEKHHREKSDHSQDTENRQTDTSPVKPLSFQAVSISDFLSKEFPPRKNILSPWLPSQGLVMIHSIRGVGKTHIGLGVAVAVASGAKFLRWEAPEPHGVLYLDGEMPAVVMQERLSHIIMAAEKQPSAPLRIITPDLQPYGTPNLADFDGQEALTPHLEGISLVIVDNISTLCRGGRENEAESWLPVQEWGLRLRTRGISVFFIHHSGKGGMQRGTSRREDVLDTIINLKHPGDYSPAEGARFEVHFEKSRGIYGDDVKPFEAKLITGPDGRQEWSMKDLEQSLTERVADLLNEGVPQHEIPEMLGVAKGTVSKHKKKAEALGLLRSN